MKIGREDCKISMVRDVKKIFVLLASLYLAFSCLTKNIENIQTTSEAQTANRTHSAEQKQDDKRQLNISKTKQKGKIDVQEIESKYQNKTTSFVLKEGWKVEIFEPQIIGEEEELSEEDRDIYEVDELFSTVLTQEFPQLLTKFEKWFIDGYGNYNIPVEMNRYVEYYIYLFTETKYRAHYEKWLRRYFLYSELIRRILISHGLPDDLVFVAMAESGFSTRAVSPMGAVGPWQFIYGTAVRYGLRIDQWVDERRDIFLSTLSAIKYLKDLYQIFGDWYLVWAAYNAGEKRIEKAIRRAKTNNFWELLRRRVIPRETAGYVPKIIALALITKNLEKFGFRKDDHYQQPLEIESVRVAFQIDIFSIAHLCGCSVEEIYNLNAHLKTPVTPPYETVLNVPKGKAKTLLEKLEYISENFLTSYENYYRINFHPVNNEEFSRKIVIGSLLIKPKRNISTAQLNDFFDLSEGLVEEEIVAPSDEYIKIPIEVYVRPFIRYRVRRGDSIAKLARRFRTRKQDILAMNNLSSLKAIRPGMVIKIPVSLELVSYFESASYRSRRSLVHRTGLSKPRSSYKAKGPYVVHVVKKGETLATISRRYGVSLERIKKVNNLKTSKIYRGQRLYIPVRSL